MRIWTRSVTMLVLSILCLVVESAPAADDAGVLRAIERGNGFLGQHVETQEAGDDALTALALLKAGIATNPENAPAVAQSPEIQAVIARIQAKVTDGVYEPTTHHIYEAGVDASLLSDVAHTLDEEHGDLYQTELLAIATYLQGAQRATGGWDYPSRPGTDGDTSVMQYAMLGLWACTRRGIEIDPTVWQRAISWHIRFQNQDGGFRYRANVAPEESTLNMTINAVGSTYIAMLHLAPDSLPDITNPRIVRRERESDDSRSFGVLQQIDLDSTSTGQAARREGVAEIPAGTEQMLGRAYNWIVLRFAPLNNTLHFKGYYYYSLERMAALASIKHLGNADWFNVCADYLIQNQNEDGSWSMTSAQFAGVTRDTCFAILFLTQSTAVVLQDRIPIDPIGGGLLRGGRGLGSGDLTSLRIDGDGIIVQAKDLGPLDEVLASLSDLRDGGIDEVQKQIVEQVQIGDRRALIDNKDRLMELVRYENPDDPAHAAEVRRTAVWALGRTNDLSLVRLLIQALDDVNYDVMLEARNALCWLSRLPNGLGEANDPLESLPEKPSPDELQSAIAVWHAKTFRNWGAWYLEHCRYENRGDEFEAWLLDRMSQL